MKITIDIKLKPEVLEELRKEIIEAGGIEAAKQELTETLLGDRDQPDEIESFSIEIEAPELEGEAEG